MTNDSHFPHALSVLRVCLGIVLVVGGWKLAFPADPEGLAQSYVDPASGWIAPFFVAWIEEWLGLEVIVFLRIMGGLEMGVGLLLVLGLGVPWVAAAAGLMLLSFAMANPAPGFIRLAQDVSMGVFALALAWAGSGTYAVDRTFGLPAELRARREGVLAALRAGLLYALGVAVIFPVGIGAGPVNETLPLVIVALFAAGLVFARTARYAAAAIAVWMAFLVLFSLVHTVAGDGPSGLYWGLDGAKRFLGLFGAAAACTLAGAGSITLLPGTRRIASRRNKHRQAPPPRCRAGRRDRVSPTGS